MADSENIGGISISVDVDLSDLSTSLDSAVQVAQVAAQQISDAFNGVNLGTFNSNVEQAAAGAVTMAQALASVQGTVAANTSAVGNLSENVFDLTDATNLLAASTDTAQTALASLAGVLNTNMQIAAVLQQSTADLDASIAALGNDVQEASSQAQSLNISTQNLDYQITSLGKDIQGAVQAIQSLTAALQASTSNQQQTTQATNDFTNGLRQLAAALAITEGLKAFGQAALEAYADLQKATIALTALTGSAQGASDQIATLKEFALSHALAFDDLVEAQERMDAFGISTEQSAKVMQAAADVAATGIASFDRVSQSILRVGESGTVSGRYLLQLGINLSELGSVLNTTSDNAAKAFKALDQEERINALTTAMQRFSGVSNAVADSLAGQWQDAKTQLEFVFQDIGAALAPVATQILSIIREDILPAIQAFVDGFRSLPQPVQEGIVIIGAMVAALAPLAAGLAALGIAITAAGTALAALTPMAITFTGAIAGALPEIALAGSALLALAGAVKGVQDIVTSETGVQISWTDSLKVIVSSLADASQGMAGFTAAATASDAVVKAYAKDMDTLTAAVNRARGAVPTADQALAAFTKSLTANTSAAQIASDMHGAFAVKVGTLKSALTEAQAALDVTTQKYYAGAASAQDVAKAYDAVTAAQKALDATNQASAGPSQAKLDRLALERERLQQTVASMGTYDAAVTQAALVDVGLTAALEENFKQQVQAITALNMAESAYKAHIGTMAQVVSAYNNLNKAMAEGQTLVGPAPALDKIDAKNILAAGVALGQMVSGPLPQIAAYQPTLEMIDQSWAKQSQHINRLAKYDMPDAIAAYQTYIGQLQAVNAPLGQIYEAQEKLAQIQITSAEQSGADATQQIIDLTNLKEKTQALADASSALGDVYVGLMKTFDDAFTEFGSQVTDAISGAESFQKAWTNVIQKIAKDIIGTLVDYALKEVKDSIIGLIGNVGSLGGVLGGIFGGKGGTSGATGAAGGVAGAASQAAASAAFVAATTAFTTAVGVFSVVMGTFSIDMGVLTTQVGLFAGEVAVFSTAIAAFASSVAAMASAVAAFATASGVEVTAASTQLAAAGTQTAAASIFATAVGIFATAVATQAASGIGDLFGGLLSIFAFKGGGEVGDVPILSYLHPKEMVLPEQYANVIRSLAGGGAGATSLTVPASAGSSAAGGGIVQVNFPNAQFNGYTSQTMNQLGTQLVQTIRRAGGFKL